MKLPTHSECIVREYIKPVYIAVNKIFYTILEDLRMCMRSVFPGIRHCANNKVCDVSTRRVYYHAMLFIAILRKKKNNTS